LELYKPLPEGLLGDLVKILDDWVKDHIEQDESPELSAPRKVDGIKNSYCLYLLSKKDTVIYEDKEWEVVRRNGGPNTFNPQYVIKRFDETKNEIVQRTAVQSKLKVKQKPEKFHLVLSVKK
jgi:hypothetical protein